MIDIICFILHIALNKRKIKQAPFDWLAFCPYRVLTLPAPLKSTDMAVYQQFIHNPPFGNRPQDGLAARNLSKFVFDTL
jgi:hypothetical protein